MMLDQQNPKSLNLNVINRSEMVALDVVPGNFLETVKGEQSVIEVRGGKTVTSPIFAVLLRHRKKELYRFSVHYTTIVKKIIAKLPVIDLRKKMNRIFEEYKKFCIETKCKIIFKRENFPTT